MLLKINVLQGPSETEEEGSVLSGHQWVVMYFLEPEMKRPHHQKYITILLPVDLTALGPSKTGEEGSVLSGHLLQDALQNECFVKASWDGEGGVSFERTLVGRSLGQRRRPSAPSFASQARTTVVYLNQIVVFTATVVYLNQTVRRSKCISLDCILPCCILPKNLQLIQYCQLRQELLY